VNGVDREEKRSGDRIFDAASKLVDELRNGELAARLKNIRQTKLEDLDLPPLVEQALVLTSRKIKGKLADLKEFASEVRQLAKNKGGEFSDKLAQNFDLPTKEDIDRLERRVHELERENEELRSKISLPKRKRTQSTKPAGKAASTKK